MRIYDLIVVDILGNKISESSERENNLLANQNTRYPENKTNMLIYLLLFILLLIIQKE
jgi:hypothetical protein